MPPNGKTMVVAGATGYIGKSVVQEGVRQGYDVISLVRDKEKVRCWGWGEWEGHGTLTDIDGHDPDER